MTGAPLHRPTVAPPERRFWQRTGAVVCIVAGIGVAISAWAMGWPMLLLVLGGGCSGMGAIWLIRTVRRPQPPAGPLAPFPRASHAATGSSAPNRPAPLVPGERPSHTFAAPIGGMAASDIHAQRVRRLRMRYHVAQIWAILRRTSARPARPSLPFQPSVADDEPRFDAIHAPLAIAEATARIAVDHAVATPPDVLAIEEERNAVTIHWNAANDLTGAQQRRSEAWLHRHGCRASWRDGATLRMYWPPTTATWPDHLPSPVAAARHDRLWLPIAATRAAWIWWPLARTEHVVVAGDPESIVLALMLWHDRLPPAHRPQMIVDDPDDRRSLWHAMLASLPVHPRARAMARQIQLARRQARQHAHGPVEWLPPPLVILIAPPATAWFDIAPLLEPEAEVQTILCLVDRPLPSHAWPLIGATAVIETPTALYPPLPDAARPLTAPPPEIGRVTAWRAGGRPVWRSVPITPANLLRRAAAMRSLWPADDSPIMEEA